MAKHKSQMPSDVDIWDQNKVELRLRREAGGARFALSSIVESVLQNRKQERLPRIESTEDRRASPQDKEGKSQKTSHWKRAGEGWTGLCPAWCDFPPVNSLPLHLNQTLNLYSCQSLVQRNTHSFHQHRDISPYLKMSLKILNHLQEEGTKNLNSSTVPEQNLALICSPPTSSLTLAHFQSIEFKETITIFY